MSLHRLFLRRFGQAASDYNLLCLKCKVSISDVRKSVQQGKEEHGLCFYGALSFGRGVFFSLLQFRGMERMWDLYISPSAFSSSILLLLFFLFSSILMWPSGFNSHAVQGDGFKGKSHANAQPDERWRERSRAVSGREGLKIRGTGGDPTRRRSRQSLHKVWSAR